MANYYREIYKMLDKVIYKACFLDRKGISFDRNGEKFSLLDIFIIKIVKKYSPTTMNEIIKGIDIDRGIVSPIINRLVQKKYLAKTKSDADKRVYKITLTEKGEELWEKINSREKGLLDFVLSDITLNEEKAVLKFLSKINQTML